MAEKAQQDERMTVDAFLEWDDGTDTRHELIDGRVVAVPTEAMRETVLARLVAELGSRMREGFRVHMGRGVRFEADPWSFRLPDAVVSSSRSDGACVQAPRLIFELLSPETVDLDGKLFLYRQILTIEAIVLLRTDRPWGQVWLPEGTHWIVHDVTGSAVLHLPHLEPQLNLDAICGTLHLPA